MSPLAQVHVPGLTGLTTCQAHLGQLKTLVSAQAAPLHSPSGKSAHNPAFQLHLLGLAVPCWWWWWWWGSVQGCRRRPHGSSTTLSQQARQPAHMEIGLSGRCKVRAEACYGGRREVVRSPRAGILINTWKHICSVSARNAEPTRKRLGIRGRACDHTSGGPGGVSMCD